MTKLSTAKSSVEAKKEMMTASSTEPGECPMALKIKYLSDERDFNSCGYIDKGSGCYPGFYTHSDNNSTLIQCDAGWFCPPDFTCRILCLPGAYCPKASSSPLSDGRCEHYDLPPYRIIDVPTCGGAYESSFCPAGSYCPSPTLIRQCPAGSYCIAGSNSPSKCPPLSSCPAGTERPTSYGFSILILALGILVPIILIKTYRYVQAQKRQKVDESVEEMRQTYIGSHTNGILLPETQYHMEILGTDTVPMDIRFSNLSLTLKSTEKVVLDSVSAETFSGRMTAILGPSGCGKTSLLNALANRAGYGTVSGKISVNSVQISDLERFEKIIGYVPQRDVMLESMTVRETLMFYANLRLENSVPSAEKKLIVQHVLKVLGLYSIRHRRISCPGERGLSGGQRKRVNIGMELVAHPAILFCDEPTSGLDSSSGLEVMRALREIAQQGVNVIIVVHQPRVDVFNLIDDLILLVEDGKGVYSGPREEALSYFASLGYECPPQVNPADFLLDVISGHDGGDLSPLELASKFVFKEPKELTPAESLAAHCFAASFRIRSVPKFWTQCRHFTWRSFVHIVRSPTALFLDFILVSASGFVLGILFRDRDIKDTTTIFLLTSMAIGMTTMLSTVPLLGADRELHFREAGMGVNAPAYFLGKNIASFIVHVLSPVAFLATFYALVTPRVGFNHLYGILFTATLAISGLAQMISVIFNERNMQLAGVVFILMLNMVAGTNPTVCALDSMAGSIPKIVSHLSYARYMVDSLVIAELNQWPPVYQYIVQSSKTYYCSEKYGLGWNITVLLTIAVFSRVLAFTILTAVVPNRVQSIKNIGSLSCSIVIGTAATLLLIGAVVGVGYLVMK